MRKNAPLMPRGGGGWAPLELTDAELYKICSMVIYFRFPLSGVLACLDGYMNIALEQTEEYANGQVSGLTVTKRTQNN